MANAPSNIRLGASMAYPGSGDNIYVIDGGGSTNFWRYSISGDSWSSLASPPATVDAGGSLASDGGNYIYAFRGNSTTDFWRYSISANSWSTLSNTPAAVGAGGRLAFVSGSGLFALRGASQVNYWKYTVGAAPRYDVVAQAGGSGLAARIEINGSTVTVLTWDIQ